MNTKLTTAFTNFTSATDKSPGVIDEGEAQSLVTIAKEMDRKSNVCCSSGDKGARELEKLYNGHKDVFESAAAKVVEDYLELNPGEFERGMKQWAWSQAIRDFGSMTPRRGSR